MGGTNQTRPLTGTTLEMKKLVLCGALLLTLLLLLLPSISGDERSKFLSDLCEKCDYCKTDIECLGCAKCSECTPMQRRVKTGKCRYCKENETVEKCKERCEKGCNICLGKDKKGLDSCKERRK